MRLLIASNICSNKDITGKSGNIRAFSKISWKPQCDEVLILFTQETVFRLGLRTAICLFAKRI